jgi:membrane protein
MKPSKRATPLSRSRHSRAAATAVILRWWGHKAARLGVALAYYSLSSIGLILLIAIAVAGFVFGREAVTGQVSETL